MAIISNVDYNSMPSLAANLREKGQDIKNEFTKAYNEIEELKENWYGVRYDELVTQFNNQRTGIKNVLDLIINQIPNALERVANNYAKVDTGATITSEGSEQATDITEISKSATENFRYHSEPVSAVRANVETCFNNVLTNMNAYASIYGNFVAEGWQSEAAEAFLSKLITEKDNIDDSVNSLLESFSKLMQDASEEVSAAESANTVD